MTELVADVLPPRCAWLSSGSARPTLPSRGSARARASGTDDMITCVLFGYQKSTRAGGFAAVHVTVCDDWGERVGGWMCGGVERPVASRRGSRGESIMVAEEESLTGPGATQDSSLSATRSAMTAQIPGCPSPRRCDRDVFLM